MNQSAMKVFVKGIVQGVGFRYHAQQEALSLNLAGYVKNLDDGRVEVWAEGETARLQHLIDWLEEGPSAAEVTAVTVEWSDKAHYSDFKIE